MPMNTWVVTIKGCYYSVPMVAHQSGLGKQKCSALDVRKLFQSILSFLFHYFPSKSFDILYTCSYDVYDEGEPYIVCL